MTIVDSSTQVKYGQTSILACVRCNTAPFQITIKYQARTDVNVMRNTVTRDSQTPGDFLCFFSDCHSLSGFRASATRYHRRLTLKLTETTWKLIRSPGRATMARALLTYTCNTAMASAPYKHDSSNRRLQLLILGVGNALLFSNTQN